MSKASETGSQRPAKSVRAAREPEIVKELLRRGQALVDSPRQRPISFTDDPDANRLIDDLDRYPHAFVLACLMGRQVLAGSAWSIPARFVAERGTFAIDALARLSAARVETIMTTPKKLHRFPNVMAGVFRAGVARIVDVYDGDASRIWSGTPRSADVVCRFLEFHGAGRKIGSMAANLLVREFKVPLADHHAIDVSADTHVRRVFGRLGLCSADASVDEVMYRARGFNPDFPGLVDYPSWIVGRTWCRATRPLCGACSMRNLCPTAERGSSQ